MLHGHLIKRHQLKKADKNTDFWTKALHFVNKFAELLSTIIVHLILIALLLIVAWQLIVSKLGNA